MKILITIRGVITALFSVVAGLFFGTISMVVRFFGQQAAWLNARFCMILISAITGCKVTVKGLEKLDKKSHYLFLGNHQSYYDIVILYKMLPYRLSFMAKKQLFMVPLFGWGMFAAGHIPVDRSNPRKAKTSMAKAIKTIHKYKRSIVAFPEGTRTYTGEIGEFKLGTFGLAKKVQIEVVPFTINGAHKIMSRKDLIPKPGKVELILSDPIPYEVYKDMDKNRMAELMKGKILENFNSEMNLGGSIESKNQ